MGCVVNGLGEAADADFGFVGQGKGMIALFRKGRLIKIVQQEKAIEEMKELVKDNGRWVERVSD